MENVTYGHVGLHPRELAAPICDFSQPVRDLEVTLSGNTLTIEGHTETREEEEKENYYRREISAGKFSRSIMLPAEVDDAKTKAIFADGVLELTFTKMVKSKRRKLKIEG